MVADGGDIDDFGHENNVVISLDLIRPGTLLGIESRKESNRLNLRRKDSFVNSDVTGGNIRFFGIVAVQ